MKKSLQMMLNETIPSKNTYPYANIEMDYIDEVVHKIIDEGKMYFFQVVPVLDKYEYAGWKFTITGDTIEDAHWLYNNLGKYLRKINQPFKIGTKKLINCPDKEQAHKIVTIYIMNNTKVDYLLNDIKHYLKGYSCKYRLKYSEHIDGPIWKRHDRDENGNYVPSH